MIVIVDAGLAGLGADYRGHEPIVRQPHEVDTGDVSGTATQDSARR